MAFMYQTYNMMNQHYHSFNGHDMMSAPLVAPCLAQVPQFYNIYTVQNVQISPSKSPTTASSALVSSSASHAVNSGDARSTSQEPVQCVDKTTQRRSKNVSFNETVLVGYTWAQDDYDRTPIEVAPLTGNDIRMIRQMRREMLMFGTTLDMLRPYDATLIMKNLNRYYCGPHLRPARQFASNNHATDCHPPATRIVKA